jgi:ribosomal protein S18 acetylase RimI-like enzyme
VAALPDAERRARSLPRLIALNVRYAMYHGQVYATPGMEGAAVWLPPGASPVHFGGMLRVGALMAPLTVSWSALRRLAALEAQTALLQREHAPMPHWYLSQIGVEPDLQGRGFGGKLLKPLLARMDAKRVPCYLETSRERNVAFYQRFGFAVAAATELGGGLRVWAMLRRPANERDDWNRRGHGGGSEASTAPD